MSVAARSSSGHRWFATSNTTSTRLSLLRTCSFVLALLCPVEDRADAGENQRGYDDGRDDDRLKRDGPELPSVLISRSLLILRNGPGQASGPLRSRRRFADP